MYEMLVLSFGVSLSLFLCLACAMTEAVCTLEGFRNYCYSEIESKMVVGGNANVLHISTARICANIHRTQVHIDDCCCCYYSWCGVLVKTQTKFRVIYNYVCVHVFIYKSHKFASKEKTLIELHIRFGCALCFEIRAHWHQQRRKDFSLTNRKKHRDIAFAFANHHFHLPVCMCLYMVCLLSEALFCHCLRCRLRYKISLR